MKKIADNKWGIIPHNKIMLRFLLIALLVINIGANANEVHHREWTIPTKGNVEYNKSFSFCTVASDEAFLQMVESKRIDDNKEIVVRFVNNNFSNTLFYEFYMGMANYVFSKNELNIDEDSAIFFKKCMNMAYE